MKPRKGCWTCAARKIQCDGGLPTCKKCARAHRDCQGYEIRLSWPRDGDNRRAAVGNDAPQVLILPNERPADLFFINTTCQDIRLYDNLFLSMQRQRQISSYPDLRRQPQQRAGHLDLIRYFHTSAYLSLITFGRTHSQIRDILLSMATAHDTAPGLALFHALLAFSSLHRYGLSEQAVQLKILALHYLSASMNEGPLISTKAAQHVCASMLLEAFEIFLPSGSSGEWVWYISGAMDTIQATHLKDQSCENFNGYLLDWVYYHNTLSRFSVHHWKQKPLSLNASDSNRSNLRNLQALPLASYRTAQTSPNPSYAILSLLSDVCDTLVDPRDPKSRDQEYHNRLRALEGRVDDLSLQLASPKSTSDVPFVVELYQMATRIYLARASQSPGEPLANLDSLIDAAFDGPVRSCTCEHFFPLFILACEARKEEQRVTILNLIHRTQRDAHIRSIEEVKNAIQSIWVQQDLYEDSDLLVNYSSMISTVISSSNTIPAFV